MENIIEKYKYTHPGELISQELIKRNASQRDFARLVGEHYQTLNAVINGRRKLTVELAYKLDMALRFNPGTLYALQAYYGTDQHHRRITYKSLKNSIGNKKAKIQFASDLHLEFLQNSDFLKNNPIVPMAEILVLAGDIGHIGYESYVSHPFWDWASGNFDRVIVVPGNHEFYGGYDMGNLSNGMRIAIRSNIHWYYNVAEVIDDVEFILTPLFSYIPYDAEAVVKSHLADFRYIHYRVRILDVAEYNNINAECVDFLKRALSAPKQHPCIVVSHHVPSFQCVHESFKGSPLNSAFYSDLDGLISDCDADYWIYGHSHRNIGEVKIGNTTLVSNQLGYIQFGEHNSFNRAATLL